MIIAIDGPAASGKGTIARKIAQRLGYRFLDTGLLYRAVAKQMLDTKLSLQDETAAEQIAKSIDVTRVLSQADQLVGYGSPAAEVAALPAVRGALLGVQRDFASRPPGAVLDGRDIGTVVCPEADVKIFVTATPEVRAHRRYLELMKNHAVVPEGNVLSEILARDERDRGRAVAPLKPAPDAHLLDTTYLDIDAAVRAAIDIVKAARTE